MERISSLTIHTKEVQREVAISIEAVRKQYQQMKDAFDQHEFLQHNPYIKKDLLALEDLLIKANLLEPREILEGVGLGDKMQTATDIFYNIVQDYHPELLSP